MTMKSRYSEAKTLTSLPDVLVNKMGNLNIPYLGVSVLDLFLFRSFFIDKYFSVIFLR